MTNVADNTRPSASEIAPASQSSAMALAFDDRGTACGRESHEIRVQLPPRRELQRLAVADPDDHLVRREYRGTGRSDLDRERACAEDIADGAGAPLAQQAAAYLVAREPCLVHQRDLQSRCGKHGRSGRPRRARTHDDHVEAVRSNRHCRCPRLGARSTSAERSARYWWTKAMAMLPSPTPDATRLIEP